ncbi:glycosyltransferase [candidate division KSB1 bacterium]|nr:glycosyltransferase [candidate division KSB1 bacterium]
MKLLITLVIFFTLLYALTIFVFLLGSLFKAKRNGHETPFVSVVVAARNEEKFIGRLVYDLSHQTYPKDKYEIIIANDGSSDSTAHILDTHQNNIDNLFVLHIKETPQGFSPKKFALHSAINHSQGDIILATDADCRVGSRWIETMISYFRKDVGFVIGFSQFGRKHESLSLLEKIQAFDFMQMMGAAIGSCNLGFPLAASGQNMGYRRQAYNDVGGYERIAHRISGDDVLLLQLIRKETGYKVVFGNHPSSFATSKAEPTIKDFINQRQRWASNGSYQLRMNKLFFAYLLMVYLYHVVLLIATPLLLFSAAHLNVLLLCYAIKLSSELAIAMNSARIFRRTDLLLYFPLWFLIQIPYIVFVGGLGLFAKFDWKGRVHLPSY